MGNTIYGVIVVGSGHAGIEAALAAARMGMDVLVLTFNRDRTGFLSCNPAVGGVGKGQLVRELDALGGEMGRAVDASAIQYRVLNRSKGYAVRSSRAQVDSAEYPAYMKKVLNETPGIEVVEGEVTSVIVNDGIAQGVKTSDGETYEGKTVVLAPGTFLNGTIYKGRKTLSAGRIEDVKASTKLPLQLKNLGFTILRFKTGTCARLEGDSVNFGNLAAQHGDDPPEPFSLSTTGIKIKQMPCYITYTNDRTHGIIRDNLGMSPLFSGIIKGTGVRYCPSIEDKVVKFPHHNRHHVFLEPEGKDGKTYYPNGISTSLPEDVQDEFIRSIEGLENGVITRYGYGIEHDVVQPTQIYPTMETKRIKNLFLAGQINGTTGYEEAAVQGFMAGVNASLKVKEERPFLLDRATAYIGVLIDDLTLKGTGEPYRMFTSRVEYRLMLREDNAGLRLREHGFRLGLVSRDEAQAFREKKEKTEELIGKLKNKRIFINGRWINEWERLRHPGVSVGDTGVAEGYSAGVALNAEIEAKYAPYIERMLGEISELKSMEKIKIPGKTDFAKIPGLSLEIQEKLREFRPMTLGQASRISGVTPAALAILLVFINKQGKGQNLNKDNKSPER